MKISKPSSNQILLEDEDLKDFSLDVKSVTGMSKSSLDSVYDVFLMCYRTPGMEASKQIMKGSKVSILTGVSSMLNNLILNDVITKKELTELCELVKKGSDL